MVPAMADGNLTQAGITRYQRHIQHLLDYTYMKSPLLSKGGASIETMAEQTYQKSPLGKSPTSSQRLVEQTYHQTSLGKNPQAYQRLVNQTYQKTSSGNFSRQTQINRAAKAAQSHYNSPPLGNLSRTTRLIQSAGFGPH
jgi:hypothetical protein